MRGKWGNPSEGEIFFVAVLRKKRRQRKKRREASGFPAEGQVASK
jgi:hypothetical protein